MYISAIKSIVFARHSVVFSEYPAVFIPYASVVILLCAYVAKPSLSHISSQVAFVTAFPNQLCAISWITSMSRNSLLSRIEAMMKVRQGFSIATMGKEGGRNTMSHLKEDRESIYLCCYLT